MATIASTTSIRGWAMCCLIAYGCWWGYFIYFLYWQEYSNNYAGATASAGLGLFTVILTFVYLVGFGIAAVKSQKHKLFLLILPLLLLPWAVILFIEQLRSH